MWFEFRKIKVKEYSTHHIIKGRLLFFAFLNNLYGRWRFDTKLHARHSTNEYNWSLHEKKFFKYKYSVIKFTVLYFKVRNFEYWLGNRP